MANFSVFWAGFIIFIIAVVNAYFVSFYGGFLIDTMFGIHDSLPGSDSEFAQAEDASGNIWFFVNFFYFLMYVWPVLMGIVWGQSILKKGGGGSYQYSGRYG